MRLNAAKLGGRGLADELVRRHGLRGALKRTQGAWTQRLDRFGPAWLAWNDAEQILARRVGEADITKATGREA